MNANSSHKESRLKWFAIRTMQDFKAEKALKSLCDEVFFPKTLVFTAEKRKRERALIPHVLFILTTRSRALELERESRRPGESEISFWIYRYPNSDRIQEIDASHIELLRLLTSAEGEGCEIFRKVEFREHQRVRVTGGIFKGYTGSVVRVRKNRHVVVRIEGICAVLLPYIHPSLLEEIHNE